MNFDDMAFAHTLKDYSVFSLVPRLSYAIRNSMLLFNWVHGNVNIHMCDRIPVWGGSKSCVVEIESYSVTSLSPRSKCCGYC